MYTGLIEEIGTISTLKRGDNSLYLTVCAKKILEGLKIGDSVAVNGVCETVIDYNDSAFTVFVSCETLEVTTFKTFSAGSRVNLERTMRLSDRLDGHLVSGHVDGKAVVKNIKKIGDTTEFTFQMPEELCRQTTKKGSIAIDGISLTIASVEGNIFKIAVIPHTLNSTNLQFLKICDEVNIETDMIAKYIEKYLSSNHNSSNIDMNLLERNGFL